MGAGREGTGVGIVLVSHGPCCLPFPSHGLTPWDQGATGKQAWVESSLLTGRTQACVLSASPLATCPHRAASQSPPKSLWRSGRRRPSRCWEPDGG